MTVTVQERDGAHRALVPLGTTIVPCCTPGHPDPEQAARHALTLAQAIARKATATG